MDPMKQFAEEDAKELAEINLRRKAAGLPEFAALDNAAEAEVSAVVALEEAAVEVLAVLAALVALADSMIWLTVWFTCSLRLGSARSKVLTLPP